MSDIEKTELSTQELNSVMEFAQGLFDANTYYGYSYGYSTPYTQNRNLINLTNISVNQPTVEDVNKALAGFRDSEQLLQAYSEFLEVYDTIFGNTIKYYDGMLSYDLSISCKNIKNPQDYKSKEYKDDLKRVYKFLDSFDYKQEFKKVTKQLLRTGVSFNWFRDSIGTYNKDTDALEIEKQRNFALQFLPQNQCILTGYFNKGSLLFDFNMSYFLDGSVDIDLFDPWFKEQYKKIWSEENPNYDPSAQLKYHTGTFANYTQTSPKDGAYCFKWDTENFIIIPPLASLMKSAVNNDIVKNLQLDKDIISAYLLLAGEIGTMDGLKSGDKPNQTKFTPKSLGQFMNLVTSGLKKNVKAVAMPLENIRGWQYNDQNPNMANSQYQSSAGQGASASGLIYNTGKMSQSELQNAIINDYNFMKKIYSQYENFLEFFINKKTKKFKFAFHLNGSNYPFEREGRQKSINELATVGLTLNTSAWASAYGYRPQEFERMLEEARYGDMSDKLILLLNKNTSTDGGTPTSLGGSNNVDNVGGAPTKDETELGDSGEISRDYS